MSRKQKDISRYTQLDGTILLEYIINNDYEDYDNFDKNMYSFNENNTKIIKTNNYKFDDNGYIVVDLNGNQTTNNTFKHLCLPTKEKDRWNYITDSDYLSSIITIKDFNSNNKIPYDTIRLHILSGYTFDSIYGILLNVFTINDEFKKINLSNWLYRKTDREYNYEKPIILNDRIFDKYIDLNIPSIKYLRNYNGNDNSILNFIKELKLEKDNLSNICISYSTISNDNVSKIYTDDINSKKELGVSFYVDGELNIEIPYSSQADNFNVYMSEATDGNYITFYTTWNDIPLNRDLVSMFNNRIKLYETVKNNVVESIYEEDIEESNWMVIHNIVATIKSNNNKVSVERYSITQDFSVNEQTMFYYKPIMNNIISNSNITNIDFDYTARLINRMDGVEIVRHGSLTTTNVHRYMNNISRISTNNLSTYNVYNKIIENKQTLVNNNQLIKNSYVKVFYNVNDIYVDKVNNENVNNIVSLKNTSSTYKFVFKKKNEKNEDVYVDLTEINSYILVYKDINDKENKINCTYSNNMNLLLGELEFNLSKNHLEKMKNSKYDYFNILIVNSDGSQSTLCEIKYKFDN